MLSDDGLVGDATLRWPDEFVRHKAADLLGDLALTGGRVQAHVIAIFIFMVAILSSRLFVSIPY